MQKATVEAWVESYITAWNSNEPQDIGQLFAQDAAYFTGPFNAPWQGREALVREWLNRKDEPGSFSFRYQVLAVTGNLGIVRGWTHYRESDREYSNIWAITLDDQNRCTEFIEWWVKRKKPGGTA